MLQWVALQQKLVTVARRPELQSRHCRAQASPRASCKALFRGVEGNGSGSGGDGGRTGSGNAGFHSSRQGGGCRVSVGQEALGRTGDQGVLGAARWRRRGSTLPG